MPSVIVLSQYSSVPVHTQLCSWGPSLNTKLFRLLATSVLYTDIFIRGGGGGGEQICDMKKGVGVGSSIAQCEAHNVRGARMTRWGGGANALNLRSGHVTKFTDQLA